MDVYVYDFFVIVISTNYKLRVYFQTKILNNYTFEFNRNLSFVEEDGEFIKVVRSSFGILAIRKTSNLLYWKSYCTEDIFELPEHIRNIEFKDITCSDGVCTGLTIENKIEMWTLTSRINPFGYRNDEKILAITSSLYCISFLDEKNDLVLFGTYSDDIDEDYRKIKDKNYVIDEIAASGFGLILICHKPRTPQKKFICCAGKIDRYLREEIEEEYEDVY